MGLFVSTVSADVQVVELGITIPHPTTDADLGSQFTADEIRAAASLTAAIQGGQLTWRKVAAGAVQPAADYDPDYLSVERENLGPGQSGDRVVTFKDLVASIAASATPPWTWGRSGNSPASTWLLNETVPSNKSGRTVFLASGAIKKIVVANEDATIFEVGLYEHDGNDLGVALLGSVTTAAQRSNTFIVNWTLTAGKQVGAKIVTGSAKNVVVGALVSGTI